MSHQPRRPKGQPVGGQFAGKQQSCDELAVLAPTSKTVTLADSKSFMLPMDHHWGDDIAGVFQEGQCVAFARELAAFVSSDVTVLVAPDEYGQSRLLHAWAGDWPHYMDSFGVITPDETHRDWGIEEDSGTRDGELVEFLIFTVDELANDSKIMAEWSVEGLPPQDLAAARHYVPIAESVHGYSAM